MILVVYWAKIIDSVDGSIVWCSAPCGTRKEAEKALADAQEVFDEPPLREQKIVSVRFNEDAPGLTGRPRKK